MDLKQYVRTSNARVLRLASQPRSGALSSAGLLISAALMAGCVRQSQPAIESPVPDALTVQAAADSTFVPFVDRAQELGVVFAYSDGGDANFCTMLESLGGGVGWLDFDRDGWLDLVATGGGTFSSDEKIVGCPGDLFRNLDGSKFVSCGASARMGSVELYSHGLAIADYDNDGFQDVLVTGYGRPQLWQNMGDGTFVESAAAAGILDDRWSSSAGWADFNGDGNLDLYLAHYVNWSFDNHPYCGRRQPGQREICPPRDFQPLPDSLYFSQGDGVFVEGAAAAGLRGDGKGLGVLLCDADADGDADIYVANDTTDNFLYVNHGTGKFDEVGIAAGVARSDRGSPDGSMGVALCDFNRDGLHDIWVSNYESEMFALYRNEGSDRFLHVSTRLGITDLGGLFVGFGTACEDFDSDGDEDIAVVNGHVLKFPTHTPRRQLPLFMQFEFDSQRFHRVPAAPGSYFGGPHEGRGLATADFDADGDLDIAVSHLHEPLALLENRFHRRNRCLAVNLIGVQSNRDAVGARVELQTRAGTTSRQVFGGGSYLSHHSRWLYFALADSSETRSLVVHWPSGSKQTLDASSLTGQVTLLEGSAEGEASSRAFVQREFR